VVWLADRRLAYAHQTWLRLGVEKGVQAAITNARKFIRLNYQQVLRTPRFYQ